ncbi:MAG: hypothetical protein BroJett018_14410 [Chloroflexota bacterium]|nr:hypothetical protein [Chloroflexota bacterium]GIK63647.1 MAG: hypothetical protein BroJett018_14410 [Chloroflexota bacterium]
MPYDAMLPVLAYYFYYAQSSTVLSHEHREQLEKWFWRTTFSERYSGASQTRMSEDAKWIQNLITDGQQIDYPLSLDLNSLVNGSMAFTTSAIRNGVLCLLNLKHPLHFENGTEIQIMGEHFSKFNLAEKHHIFPVGFLRDQKNLETRQVHKIPNFCFIPQDLNRRLGDKPPSIYLSRIAEGFSDLYDFEKIMRSHLIPVGEDSGVWADDYQLFLRQRAQLILDEIKRRCGVSSLITNEVRNPAIDSIEKGLRENIHITLASLYGPDYWRDAIPSDIQKSVTDRIEEYVRKTAGTTKSMFHDPRARLDFCDVADYVKIISFKQNWSSFSAYYRSRAECEQMLRDFKDFRNAVKHNREVDSVLNHRGQAALIWFARVLNLDLADYGIY